MLLRLIVLLLFSAPTLQALGSKDNTEFQSGAWWSIVLICGVIPGVLTNIMEESVFHDFPNFNISMLLSIASIWQLVTVVGFFWMDLIPSFGTSGSISAWKQGMHDGMLCFFTPNSFADTTPKCKYCAAMGILFAVSFSASFIFGSLLFRHCSANYNALVSSFGNPLAVIFWMVVPAANAWANGPSYTREDLSFSAGENHTWLVMYPILTHTTQPGSLPLILVGVVLFRMKESSQKGSVTLAINDPDADPLLVEY